MFEPETLYKVNSDIDASQLDDDQLEDLIDGIDEIIRRDACNRVFDVRRQLCGYLDADGNYHRFITIDGSFTEGAIDDLAFLLEDFNVRIA